MHIGDLSSHDPAEKQLIWEELGKIVDPEIPVLSLVEMKVIRDVKIGDGVTVIFSPTFVGCPATSMIMQEIRSRLNALGFQKVTIETTFSPPWSTDLLDERTKEKLRQFGVAPPPVSSKDLPAALLEPVACPSCGSMETRMESSFGSTLCRQIYYCHRCRQSFERFKPL
jgi:ring-1,2-phenylacetyl-CoA epoxidase subunit PaaD